MFFTELGLQTETQKELMLNFMNVAAILNNIDEITKIKKEIFRLIYPDIKSEDEKLLAEASRVFNGKDEIMRVTANVKKTVSIPSSFRKK